MWTGEENANLVAWGAETGLDNGFQDGEEFTWMVWDNETDQILPAIATYDEIMPNEGYFANNGLSAITSLQALSSVTQTVNLTPGWSLWSTYVHPEVTDISYVVSSIDLDMMLEQHVKTEAKGTLALWKVEDPSRFGVVEYKNNEILQFQEKPEKGTELSNLINAGTYLLEPEIFEMIPINKKVSIEREIYPKIAGNRLYGFPFEGYFIDAGTPESYLEANFKTLGNSGTAAHSGASIRGKCMIHESAKLEDCIVGPNAIIGPDVRMEKCVVRKSVILSNVTGYGSVVEDCIIGPGTSFEKDLKRTLISPEGTITF